MKNSFTLSTVAALLATAFSAQAQITVDGMLGAGELGSGPGQYQLVVLIPIPILWPTAA